MKNVRYILCAFALLMCSSAYALRELDEGTNFTANSLGGNKVSFHLMVRPKRTGDANHFYSIDHINTLSGDSISTKDLNHTSYLWCEFPDSTEASGRKTLILLYYGSFNEIVSSDDVPLAEVCKEKLPNGKPVGGWMAITKSAGPDDVVGLFTITNSRLSKYYPTVSFTTAKWSEKTKRAGGFTQHALDYQVTHLVEMDIHLDGTWEMPSYLAGKDVNLYMHFARYSSNDNRFLDEYNLKLGTFNVDNDMDPILSDPFFYPMDENGNPLVGKLGAVYSSMQQPVSCTVHYGTVTFDYPNPDMGGVITMDAADTAASLYLDMVTYYAMSDTVTAYHKTNIVTLPPLHKIYDFHVEPYADENGTDRNFNKLSWTIKHSNIEDIGAGDLFVAQRATRPDFSDAEDLPLFEYLPLSTGQDTTLTFIDTTFSGSLPEDGKLYYRLTRGYATVWEWIDEAFEQNYCVKDSINNHTFLWSLYDNPNSDIVPIKAEIINGASAMVHVNLCDYQKGDGTLYDYTWDKRAKLYLTRINTITGEETQIDLLTRPEAILSNCHDDITGQTVWSYKFLDNGLYPCSTFRYSVSIDDSECLIHPKKDALLSYDGTEVYSTENIPVEMQGFSAAQGEDKNFVLLSWKNDPSSVDAFIIDYRKQNDTEWKRLAEVKDENYYEDYDADPGQNYEYRIYATYTCYDVENESDTATAIGWLYPYGSISGTVMMPNGTGIQGVTVVITDTLNHIDYYAVTDISGHYRNDSLAYSANGTVFVVSVPDVSITYTSAATGEASMNVIIKPHDADKTNYIFCPDKFYSVTGRVLYHNTSVPVAYAEFETQLGDTLAPAMTMTNSSGEPVRSDLNGYFTLQVPANLSTLRVKKEDHTFLSDGYLIMENRKDLALTDDLREIRFYDLTKAHVLGRVSAGILESQFALGTDSSTNRLGDDITLVLELEGDKISQLVNDPNDLSRTTFDTVIVHQHPWDKGGSSYVFHTEENTTRKRVTIHADNVSGEFHAELLPVRYKIVEMSATGYTSLLDPDEAMPVLDLTEYNDNTDPYELNYVYHSTPVIAYKQASYGMMMPYFGECYTELYSLDTTAVVPLVTLPDSAMKVCLSVSEKIEGASYLFGHPVFASQKYGMRVGVYEPYYYNNDSKASALYSVPLQGELKVYNNLTAEMTTGSYTLNKKGETSFNFVCNNVSFSRTGENALRTLNMSFTYNGKAIQSEPLQAYVIGARDLEGGVMQKLGETIELDDILRDPYGVGSSATLEEGVTYSTNYHINKTTNWGIHVDLTITPKTHITSLIIAGFTVGKSFNFQFGWPIKLSFAYDGKYQDDDTYTYTYTTSSSISTSSGTTRKDVGAEADVYIGHTNEIGYTKKMAIQMADSLAVALYASNIAKGNTHVITQGRDPQGKPYYLLVTEAVAPVVEIGKSQFVYSQYHILKTIIPDLTRKRNDLITRKPAVADSAMVVKQLQARANELKQMQYLSLVPDDDKHFGADGYYLTFKPTENLSITETYTDEVAGYNQLIHDWQEIIKLNERQKTNISYTGTVVETYSLSSGASISYSETSNIQHGYFDGTSYSFSGGLSGDKLGTNDYKDKKEEEEKVNIDDDDDTRLEFKMPVTDISLSITPIGTGSTPTVSYVENKTYKRTVSYRLGADAFGSINQTVYRITNDSWKKISEDDPDGWWSEAYKKAKADKAVSPTNDFVFVLNGGATACPWLGPDSAHFLSNTQLSARTLKLDKPTITLDRYEQSDIPADEAAFFTVTLANESEQITGKPTAFNLLLTDGTNPNGLSVYMDGLPIGAGRQFYIDAGESLTKVIEVRRGNGYDFENVELRIISSCDIKMADAVRFSVHYVPVASPVTVSAPDDKWVLNTLSEQDADGFYLPVTISGFDINYDNFDHIEFQYKLSTEGESKWVNLCSYYANDSLYQMATGKREMIKSIGKIEGIHFYGERDPMEQHYDLRAVSFSRYGNGFITRTSPVVSGIKDTRIPDVFGKTSPTSGILTYEDNIRINFTEDIAGQYLDKDNNFQVLGATNSISMETGTSLFFPGTATARATSRATRSVSGTNFTIDLMAQAEDDLHTGQLFALYDDVNGTENMAFGITRNGANKRVLYATIDGYTYISKPLTVTLRTFQRLALEYDVAAVTDKERVTFRMNTGYIDVDNVIPPGTEFISKPKRGLIILGVAFTGRIMEVRLWDKILSTDEYGNTQAVRLTGFEHGLLAYWPLDEGGTAQESLDKAHGNHLDLDGLSWQMPEGCSLHFTKQDGNNYITLSDKLVSRNSASDYTIMFWWKCETVADTVALFTTGRGTEQYPGLFIGLEHGRVVVLGNGYKLSSSSLVNDIEWHHFTLTVNRSQNLANVYVDEQLVAQSSATGFPGISGTPVLGGCVWSKEDHGGRGDFYPFSGHLDFFSLWQSALPLDFISQYAQHAPSGEEIALQAYLQLHRKYLNTSGIYEIAPSVFNEVCKRDEATGKIAVEANMNKDTLLFCNADLLATLWDKTVYAPVQESQKMGKLNYQYKAKDDQLLIELTDPEKQINKQQVYIAVREVEDLNGNPIASTITVPVFVDLNRIRWSDYSIERTVNLAQSDAFTATIINRCGSNKQYTITTDADWLKCSSTSGQLSPKEERDLTFTISDGLNPGEYSTIAYVIDEMDLAEPLLVNVTVLANEPEWKVDKSDKDVTASLYGRVRIKISEDNYVFDMDERDIVGIFVGPECIGKANIMTDNDGHSDLFITLYGNDAMKGQLVSVSLWRASSGVIYKLIADADIYFEPGGCYGCEGTPVILSTTDKECIQLFSLNQGWNWISTYLNLDEKATLDNTILKNKTFQVGDEIKNSHYKVSAQFVNVPSAPWNYTNGKKMILNEQDVYAVKSTKGGDIECVGTELPDSLRKVIVIGQKTWCQLPYLCETTQSVTDALTTYFQFATPGDIVKGYDQFAIFTVDKRWVGSLEFMRPGQGYFIKSASVSPVTITYVNNDNPYRAPKKVNDAKDAQPASENVVTRGQYNMPMVATACGVELEQGDCLRAISGDDCVGEAVMTGDSLFFITVYNGTTDDLSFEIVRNGIGVAKSGKKEATYSPNGSLGTYETPYIIHFEQVDPDPSAIRKEMIDGILYIHRNGNIYNAQGGKL